MSRSQQGLMYSKYDFLFCIFWTAGRFATKLSLIVQHHKPECPVEKWDDCVQGQGHNKGPKCRWIFARTIFSESQKILLPNLVWWSSIMSQSHADIFVVVAIFKVKVTARAHMIKIWFFLLCCLNCWFFEARVSYENSQRRVKILMFFQMIPSKPSNHQIFRQTWYHHHVSECHAKIFICYFQDQDYCKLIWSKYDNFYRSFWIADPFASKLGLLVHNHKLECFMEKLHCCVQGQGHSKISKCQWMFVQIIFSKSLNILLPNLVWWCISMTQIVFQKDWFAVFKVKVTVKNNI